MSIPRWTAPVLLCALPGLVQLPFIWTFGVDVPFQDQWGFVGTLQHLEAGRWRALFDQHNEHRILFPRLFFLALLPLTRWDLVAEMYASALVQVATLWGLFVLYRRSGGEGIWGLVPVAFLTFSLGQWQNILSGWQVATYLADAGAVWAFVLLGRARVWPAVLVGILSTFSLANGLLVWPCGLALLAWQRAPRRALLAWALAGGAMFTVYFRGYVRPVQVRPWTSDLGVHTLEYFLTALGGPLGAGHVPSSLAAGILLCVVAGLLLWRLQADPSRRDVAPCLALLGFSTGSAALIALGRASATLEPATFSKYTSITALGLVAVYLLALREWRREGERALLLLGGVGGALALGLLAANAWGLKEARGMHDERCRLKSLLQTLPEQPDWVLAGLSHDPAALRMYAGFLAERRLSAYADPREVVLLFRWRDGVPAAEVLPDRPIVQSIVCPVPTLHDVGVQVATFGGRSSATSTLSVAVDGVKVASRSVGSRALTDAGWFTVAVQPAVACQGRTVTVTVASPDAQPGTGITAWTYPPYYDGTLTQPGASLEPGRVLGMQLNASACGR